MVSCLVDGKNHEPCCKGRGVPDVCSNFCAGGKISKKIEINLRYNVYEINTSI